MPALRCRNRPVGYRDQGGLKRMEELAEFHRELIADVQGDADAMGLITAEAFLEKIGDILDEAGEVSSLGLCYFDGKDGTKPLHVDAYGWDQDDEEGVLTMAV